MPAYPRWKFDDNAGDTYTFEVNPNEMGSPYPDVRVSTAPTTAPDGQIIITEGARAPKEWSFSGVLLSTEQHDEFVAWLNKKQRIYLWDHYGRRMTIFITGFAPTPKRRVGTKHTYTVTALVLSPPFVPSNAVWTTL